MEKKSPGRPEGKPYPVKKLVRLSEADAADLRRLVDRWRCSEVEAVRRAIRESAEGLA
jgi:hypothetical protein